MRPVRAEVAAVAVLVILGGCSSVSSSASGKPTGRTQTAIGSATKASDVAASSSHRLTLNPKHDYGELYKNGLLPVGDGHYKDNQAKKGYVDACPTYVQALTQGGGGAQARGPWFKDGNQKYQIKDKVSVRGSVHWHAVHSFKISGGRRILKTNDLPTHTSGTFPISSSDPASSYDRNPNHIASQKIDVSVPKSPKYGAAKCMGGMVGVMTTGVLLFNGFDAGGRDAGAWEVQDHCDAHPDMSSTYHYHTLSRCITNLSVHHVIGWALDGFPITGPDVKGKTDVLTTRNLDVCHGITSKVTINGKSVTTYHYVMTADFPYSMSCFRGTPVTTGPLG